jgi:hypothetical protein
VIGLKLLAVLITCGSQDHLQAAIPIQILGSKYPSTTLKLSVLQHHFSGPLKSIGTRIPGMFHGTLFLLCLASFNDRRQKLIKTMMMLVDESMSGWHSKTTKLGGLPNYTFEPRKPVPLGNMFRNGMECISGILVVQDVVRNPEQQLLKSYFWRTISTLPNGADIGAHTAEVLWLVEGAGIPKSGWVGGDSWFGSTATAVEVMNKFGVHSYWIIKQNQHWFPMKQLYAVLKARFKDRPAGHWVVFHGTVSGVELIAMAYACSQRGISYTLCGFKTSRKNVPVIL